MKPPKIIKRVVVSWALYDWACSAFSTVVITFIFAAYFARKVAPNTIVGTQKWGYAMSLAGIIIVLLSPIFGAIADSGGRRKPWLAVFTSIIIIGSALLWYAYPNARMYATLSAVIIGAIGMEISQVFYNALLPNVSPPNYIGRISGWSWGLGYAGGLVALTVCLFAFVESSPSWLNPLTAANIRICGPFVACWIALFAIPLFICVPDYPKNTTTISQAIRKGLRHLWSTFKTARTQRNIFLFLLARMVYLDGLNTIFAFGGIYAAGTFGLSLAQVIQFGIATNVTAGLGAIGFAWVDDWLGAKRTVLAALLGLLIFSIAIVLVHSIALFWILALILSLFFGPAQAASRSLMTRLVPKEKITQMFGLYTISGKVTAFIGPWVVGYVTFHTHSQRLGIASVIIFFIIGAVLLSQVKENQ